MGVVCEVQVPERRETVFSCTDERDLARNCCFLPVWHQRPEDCFILGRRHLPTHIKPRVPGLKSIHPLVVPVLQSCAMPLPPDGAGASGKGKVICQPQRTKCPHRYLLELLFIKVSIPTSHLKTKYHRPEG